MNRRNFIKTVIMAIAGAVLGKGAVEAVEGDEWNIISCPDYPHVNKPVMPYFENDNGDIWYAGHYWTGNPTQEHIVEKTVSIYANDGKLIGTLTGSFLERDDVRTR